MKKYIIALLISTAIITAAGVYYFYFSQTAIVKQAIKNELNDPSSAAFKNFKYPSKNVICGEVNAKNRMGAFVGYKPFHALVINKDAFVTISRGDNDSLYKDLADECLTKEEQEHAKKQKEIEIKTYTPPTWEYRTSKDEMSNKETHYAEISAIDDIPSGDFKDKNMMIRISISATDGDCPSVYIHNTKTLHPHHGYSYQDTSNGSTSIKFDDAPAKTFSTIRALQDTAVKTLDRHVLFATTKEFIKEIQKSNIVKVQFQEANQTIKTYSFKTENINIEKIIQQNKLQECAK